MLEFCILSRRIQGFKIKDDSKIENGISRLGLLCISLVEHYGVNFLAAQFGCIRMHMVGQRLWRWAR
jgi:hypothetical protein